MSFSGLLLNKINKYHENGINPIFIMIIGFQMLVTVFLLIEQNNTTAIIVGIFAVAMFAISVAVHRVIRGHNMELSKAENYVIMHTEQIDKFTDNQKQKILETIIIFQFHVINYKNRIVKPLQEIIECNQ